MKIRKNSSDGFTLMELLVVIAIIVILAAVAFPVYGKIKASSNKATALNSTRNLAASIAPHAAENDGNLPFEETDKDNTDDSWNRATETESDGAWYNTLPRKIGAKGVGDYAKEKRYEAFYSKENILFLSGATYPGPARRLEKPLFAFALNSMLQRKDKAQEGSSNQGGSKQKFEVKLAAIHNPVRTVIFVEQGLPDEPAACAGIAPAENYLGKSSGTAKSFVARYAEKGILAFVDGHAEEVAAKDILRSNGDVLWEADWTTTNPSAICWTQSLADDPNED